MAVFDLDARITEEDLSKINRKTRQAIFLYVEAENEPKTISLRTDLKQFLNGILQEPSLMSSTDIEICVFSQKEHILLKECSPVENSELAELTALLPTNGQSVYLAPILQYALDRINDQKKYYRTNGISYGKPVLLFFTAGNIADKFCQIQDVVARPLRETSVDILPICENTEDQRLKAISSKGTVIQMPVSQAYKEVFVDIHNSMERLSKSTAATYQELAECLVDGSRYFQ